MKKETIFIIAGYVLFLLLFFFIGIPKTSLLNGIVGFLLVSAVYALIVKVVKKISGK
jgi:hypothetical protein